MPRIARRARGGHSHHMTTLHIEHVVPDFDAWKRTFDSYATKRAEGGVRSYRVLRPIDDQSYSIVDLEFDDVASAQAFLAMLEQLWARRDGTIIKQPRG